MIESFKEFKQNLLETLDALVKSLTKSEKKSEYNENSLKIFENFPEILCLFSKNSVILDDILIPAISSSKIPDSSRIIIKKCSISFFPTISLILESFEILSTINYPSIPLISLLLDLEISEKFLKFNLNYLLKFKSFSNSNQSIQRTYQSELNYPSSFNLSLSVELRLSHFDENSLKIISSHLSSLKKL
jgi:hypothetical protein